ncbi:MAG TPA: hypothetical protein VGT44_10020 [Ktedonobacteraceae bacterium]|nr:hypothetical protein [Ktedonobacteraceae bacterium]
MSSWTIPQPGPNIADADKPVVVFQSDADFNAVFAAMQAQQLARQVHTAVALGWSLSELLGRAFLLKDDAVPNDPAWNGAQLIALPEADSAHEKVRALMEHILFLADVLDVRAIPIDSDAAPTEGATYADVLRELVKKLSTGRFDVGNGEMQQSVLGSINERLFYWDYKIHYVLQNNPMVVHRAYLVGQSLGALRWYYRSERSALDQETLDKVCHEYIPMLGPYLPPFATGALSNSVEVWGKAALTGQVMQDNSPYSPVELHNQAHIWYDILTGSRRPLSYVDNATHGARYMLRVARVAWPLFVFPLVALLLILVVALVVILANFDQVVKAVAAAATLVALVSTSHLATSNITVFVERALSHSSDVFKGSPIESLWQSTQQKAVNDATCILPLTPPATLVTPASANSLPQQQQVVKSA